MVGFIITNLYMHAKVKYNKPKIQDTQFLEKVLQNTKLLIYTDHLRYTGKYTTLNIPILCKQTYFIITTA